MTASDRETIRKLRGRVRQLCKFIRFQDGVIADLDTALDRALNDVAARVAALEGDLEQDTDFPDTAH